MRTILLAVLCFALPLLPGPAGAETGVYTRLSMIEGDIQVSGRDREEWTDAELNIPLDESDRIWVHEGGRTELHVSGGFFIRADGETSLDILSLDDGSLQFYLDRGHIYVNNLRGGVKVVQLDTPLTSIRSYDNSIMMLDVNEDGKTEVAVLKGYVTAENRAGATRVGAGNTLTISGEGTVDLSPIGPTDDWERWNIDRDRQFSAWSESSRYLPEELQEYSSDLDRNGTWVYVPEYGYTWTPGITVVAWAPYTVGRWTWFRGDYVWVSAEPWGWAPYHYGRWVFVGGRGWCWVPPRHREVYWGPGYVGWVVTDTTVAWVPLAPGEIFYGYGYYGPNSVNLLVVNINTIVVNRNYRNRTVEHGVVVTDRHAFTRRGWQRHPFPERADPFGRRTDKREIVPPRVVTGDTTPHRRDQDRERKRDDPTPRVEQRDQDRRTGQDRSGQDRERKRDDDRRQLEPQRRTVPPAATPFVQPRADMQERKRPPERVQRNRPDEIKAQRRLTREREGSVFRQERPPELNVRQQKEPRVIERKRPQEQPKQKKEEKDREQQEQKRFDRKFERR